MAIPYFRPRLNGPAAVWLVIMLAVAGFAGLLQMSFLKPAPTFDLVEVSTRLAQARADASTPQQAEIVSEVTAQLYAAQRAITLERNKAWRLRSYDRARLLIEQAERNLDSFPPRS